MFRLYNHHQANVEHSLSSYKVYMYVYIYTYMYLDYVLRCFDCTTAIIRPA